MQDLIDRTHSVHYENYRWQSWKTLNVILTQQGNKYYENTVYKKLKINFNTEHTSFDLSQLRLVIWKT